MPPLNARNAFVLFVLFGVPLPTTDRSIAGFARKFSAQNLTPGRFHVPVLFMHDAATSPDEDPCACTACTACAAAGARQTRMLEELSEIAMDLARALGAQALAVAAEDPPRAAELSLAFTRMARTVRQTLALEARLRQQVEARDLRLEAERRTRAARAANNQRKLQVAEIAREAIEAGVADDGVGEALAELYERLGDDEVDFTDRPIGALVAKICRDLGVSPDWSQWAAEAWAVDEALARAPGSPYAGWPYAETAAQVVAAHGGMPPDLPDEAHPPP
jgi:hypothetical protein